MFSGVKPDVSGYRVWGCLVHVLVPDFQRSTFAPKTVQGMFTGYEVGSKAYRVYLGERHWKVSRDMYFREHLQGVGLAGVPVHSTDPTFESISPHIPS